jgi:hypothetical protein
MPQNSVDLAGIFGAITQSLAENQQSLNQADGANQNHGDNMVQTFQTITSALQQKHGSSDGTALRYAANQLSSNTASSSGQLYAQNLAQAANQFQGKSIDMQGAMGLLQTLIGGQAGAQGGQAAGNDPSSMMSSLSGGGTSSQGGQPGGDIMSSLLGGLTGEQPGGAGVQGGFDMQNLLNAGVAFLQARQTGESSTQALVQAFMSGSGMGNASHREQSTQLVVNSFLQALNSFGSRP